MLKKIKKALKNPNLLLAYILNFKIFRILPDDVFLKIKFWLKMGKKLDLKNPKTFNEKLQWLKLYDRKPEYTPMVDKYQVRRYVADTIGEGHLIPLLGVYESFEQIDFKKLPSQFVLKCTHDSGGIILCKDKNKLNIKAARRKINKCLKRNFYYVGREWPYKNVKPRIICEKYMVDESGTELKDYKIFCFNGLPKIIQVDFDRFKAHKKNLYDTNWNYIPVSYNYQTDPSIIIKKPGNLEDMLKFAKILARSYPFVRVDFYSIYNELYFGEITFYPASGFGKFTPEKYDYILGDWLKLPV
mgnify:CR=1 FL=1